MSSTVIVEFARFRKVANKASCKRLFMSENSLPTHPPQGIVAPFDLGVGSLLIFCYGRHVCHCSRISAYENSAAKIQRIFDFFMFYPKKIRLSSIFIANLLKINKSRIISSGLTPCGRESSQKMEKRYSVMTENVSFS